VEGDGVVIEHVGGYSDRVSHVPRRAREVRRLDPPAPSREPPASRPRRRLSYMEQRELDALPARIEALEDEQRALHAQIAGPDFYKERADAIAATLARVDALEQELTDAYSRWDALDARVKA